MREIYTGKSISIREVDTIIFDSVSRISRTAEEVLKLYRYLYNNGVNLIFLNKRHIDIETDQKELEKQIDIDVTTSDGAADELIKTIFNALGAVVKLYKFIKMLNYKNKLMNKIKV